MLLRKKSPTLDDMIYEPTSNDDDFDLFSGDTIQTLDITETDFDNLISDEQIGTFDNVKSSKRNYTKSRINHQKNKINRKIAKKSKQRNRK